MFTSVEYAGAPPVRGCESLSSVRSRFPFMSERHRRAARRHAGVRLACVVVALWLGVLAVCLVGTLLCTAVLVAWPIIANMIAG